MKKKVHVRKIEPPRCAICRELNVTFYVSYTDPDNPGPPIKLLPNLRTPTNGGYFCAGCVVGAITQLVPEHDRPIVSAVFLNPQEIIV